MSESTLTLESLLKALPYTERERNPLLDSVVNPLTFRGMPIFEIEPDIRPVLRVRDEVPCTDTVRHEVNEYLLKTFGTRDHSALRCGQALFMSGFGLAIRKDDCAAMLLSTIT